MYGFDGVALVAKHDRVVMHDAFGRAHVAQHYDAGSIMKTFVAAAILQLEEEGRLRVTDKVLGDITIHQLLTHTSGLPLDPPNPTEDLFAAAANAKLVAAPGERYAYSNFGYGILLAMVERASGQQFAAYARAHLLEPAGMRESRFWTEPALPGETMAAAFTGNSDEELEPAEPLVRNGPQSPMWGKYTFGAGGIITTAADLHRWWRWLAKHPELQRYGWNIVPDKIYRGGLVRASYISMLAYYRKHDAVLIYLINRNTGWHLPIEKNVERILAHQPYVLPPPVIRGDDVLIAGDSQEALSFLWSLTPEQRAAAANVEPLVASAMGDEPFEIIGTTRHPSGPRNLQTFVRTGNAIKRVITDGTKVLAVANGVPPSAMRRFRKTGKDTYASYDPVADAVITMRKTDAGYVLENAAGERVVSQR